MSVSVECRDCGPVELTAEDARQQLKSAAPWVCPCGKPAVFVPNRQAYLMVRHTTDGLSLRVVSDPHPTQINCWWSQVASFPGKSFGQALDRAWQWVDAHPYWSTLRQER